MHILKVSTAIFTFASPVAAQTVGDTYLGSGISTFGATLEAAYQIEPLARVRGIAMGGVRVDCQISLAWEQGRTANRLRSMGKPLRTGVWMRRSVLPHLPR